MKKIILSTSILIIFIAYAIHSRATSEIPVIAPTDTSNNTQTPTPTAPSPVTKAGESPTPTPTLASSGTKSIYKDGSYIGDVTDAYYGNVQVKAIIQGGKITDVQFLDYPHDRGTSREINSQAMPYLTSEAIQAQSAQVDIVSGATQTSLAFRQSLQSALAKAKNS